MEPGKTDEEISEKGTSDDACSDKCSKLNRLAPLPEETENKLSAECPEVLDLISALRKYISKQARKLKKLRAKLKAIKKRQDVGVQTDEVTAAEAPAKTFSEEIKEAAEEAMQNTGFVYEETSGMYYDYNTGYYYNAVSNVFKQSFYGFCRPRWSWSVFGHDVQMHGDFVIRVCQHANKNMYCQLAITNYHLFGSFITFAYDYGHRVHLRISYQLVCRNMGCITMATPELT